MAARLHTSYVKLPSVPIFNHIQRSCSTFLSLSLSPSVSGTSNYVDVFEWILNVLYGPRNKPTTVTRTAPCLVPSWRSVPWWVMICCGMKSLVATYQKCLKMAGKAFKRMGKYGNTIWNCLILGLSGLSFWRLTANLLHEDQPNESQEQPMPAFCANRIQVLWCTLRRSWSLSRLNAEVETWCDAARYLVATVVLFLSATTWASVKVANHHGPAASCDSSLGGLFWGAWSCAVDSHHSTPGNLDKLRKIHHAFI